VTHYPSFTYNSEYDALRDGSLVVTRKLVNDVILALAYMKMVEEGSLETVFHVEVPTLTQFIKTYSDPAMVVMACFEHEEGAPIIGAKLCGLGWALKAARMGAFQKAELGMVFFRRGRKYPRANLRLGHLILRYYFDEAYGQGVDFLFGSTPEQNVLARKYAQKIGMTMHGPIPNFSTWKGLPCPVWVSHISKLEYLERNR
jgi:hypothetical protein